MPIKSPKAKGSQGEYEIIRLLTFWASEVGVKLDLERNLEQTRCGGADVNGVPGLEVEVKRQQVTNLKGWWQQVCKAAKTTGNRPFLCHRKNRQPWQFRAWVFVAEYDESGSGAVVPLVVDMELAQARVWFQHYLKHRID